jgi:hypothetical protein
MSEVNNIIKSVQVGTVDFFGILLPGLLTTVTTITGFFIPIFFLVLTITGARLPAIPLEPTLLGFALVLLVLFSYVLGYILRLSSPDELDKISARNVILRELDGLHEQNEKHPEDNQDYKVRLWFRLILHYPWLRKKLKGIMKESLLNEEKKFSAFVSHDAWPYNPDEPLDKYPYFNFYWYLEHRGHSDLANMVTWGSDDEDSRNKRSKTAVNRMKMAIRYYCPQLSKSLESKEGHIRLMAGTWSAFRIAMWLVSIASVVVTIPAIMVPQLRWLFIFSFVNLSMMSLMQYSIRRIEKLFHYRRVSELFHIVQAAHFAQQIKATERNNEQYLLEEAD